MLLRFSSLVLTGILCSGLGSAQAPATLPPIPNDPLELVTGAAQSIQTAEQRAAAINLLTHARDLSNVRAQPYDLKTSFTTSGGLPSDGSWMLEDISPGRGIYRWTAQGPNYAGVNLYTNTTQGMLYSNQPSGNLPLRLTQVRSAIFFVNPIAGPQASIRTASGFLNGAAQQCVLSAPGFGGQTFTGGRSWDEIEYCVDGSTGLLTTFSPVPGLYVRYDYSSAKQFHGKTIAGGFTITESGRVIAEAKIESVSDPPSAQESIFNTAGLAPVGAGQVMTGPVRVHMPAPPVSRFAPASTRANPALQVVVVHGALAPDGRLNEVEIVASSDPGSNQTALDRANHWPAIRGRTQPGATPQSQEIFFTMEFAAH